MNNSIDHFEKTQRFRLYIKEKGIIIRTFMDNTVTRIAEIKRLKQECHKGSLRLGCNDVIRDMLEDLDLRNIEILKILENFRNSLEERLYGIEYDSNNVANINNIIEQELKKIDAAGAEYKRRYDKMYDLIDMIEPQEVEEEYTPINTPSLPHTPVYGLSPVHPDEAKAGNKRKSTTRRRRTRVKKRKRRRKTQKKKRHKRKIVAKEKESQKKNNFY